VPEVQAEGCVSGAAGGARAVKRAVAGKTKHEDTKDTKGHEEFFHHRVRRNEFCPQPGSSMESCWLGDWYEKLR
jgi:hypothetical protein